MATFNEIICDPSAPIICGEAMRDYLLDCDMRRANEYWDNGIVQESARAQTFAQGCHKAAQEKFWLPVEYAEGGIVACGTEENLGDADCPDCEGLKQDTETMFKLYTRNCWAAADCEAQCQSCDEDDVIDIVISRVVTPYMVRDNVEKLFSQAVGLYAWADGQAADIKDEMIVDLGTNELDHCAGIDLNNMRDCGEFDGLYVHKNVYVAMRKSGCLQEKVCCGDTDFEFASLADGTVIIPVSRQIADRYLVDPAGDYISIAFNFGAFEYAEGCHKTPFERYRDPKAHCGDGMESIFFRREFVLRPFGTEFDTTGLAKDYASHAELRDGARWNVKIPLEFFGLGFVKSQIN